MATDTFDGSGALSGSWTVDAGTCARSSGVAVSTGSGDENRMRWNTEHSAADIFAEANLLDGNSCGLIIRINSANTTQFYLAIALGNFIGVYRGNGGSYSGLFNTSGGTFSNGDLVYFEAEGNTLRVYINGVLRGSGTDSNYAGGSGTRYTGIRFEGNESAGADNWRTNLIGVGEGPPPPDPDNIDVEVDGDEATITHDASSGVDDYSVYTRFDDSTPPSDDPFDPESDTPFLTEEPTTTHVLEELEAGYYAAQVFGRTELAPGLTLVAQGSWAYSNATTQTVTIPDSGSLQAGDVMVMLFGRKPYSGSTPSVNESWSLIGTPVANGTTANGNGTGSVLAGAAIKVHDGSESNPQITWGTTSAPGGAVILVFRPNNASSPTSAGDGGGDTSSGTGFSVTVGSNPGVQAGDTCIAFAAIADDGSFSSRVTFTQTGVTWDTVSNPVSVGSTTTSNDMSFDLGIRVAASGTGSAAPVITATLGTSETGTAFFIRLRPTGSPVDQFTVGSDVVTFEIEASEGTTHEGEATLTGTGTIVATGSRGVNGNVSGEGGAAALPTSGIVRRWRASDLGLDNDDPVASWVDTVGSDEWAQASSGSQPTFKTNVLNGKAGVLFDGTNDYLSGSPVDPNPGTGKYWVGAVVQKLSGDADTVFYNGFENGFGLRTDCDSFVTWLQPGVSGGATYIVDLDQADPLAVVGWSDNDGASIFINGSTEAQGTSSGADSAGTGNLVVGARNETGGPDDFWPGYIFEINFWDHDPTTEELEEWWAYVQAEYGLDLGYPTTGGGFVATAEITAEAATSKGGHATVEAVADITAEASVERSADAALEGVATITAEATVDLGADAALEAIADIAVAAAVERMATAALEADADITAEATVEHGASASLGGTGTITGTASVERTGTAALSALATATVEGQRQAQAAATLTGTATITATAATRVVAEAALSASATLAVEPVVRVMASATLTAETDQEVATQRIATGSAVLNAVGTVAVEALREVNAGAELSGTATISVGTQGEIDGTATLAGTATLVATSTREANVGASLTSTAEITATAASDLAAQASLDGTGTVVVVAAVERPASATLSASGTLSVAGYVVHRASATRTAVAHITADTTGAATGAASLSASASLTVTGRVVHHAAVELAATSSLAAAGHLIQMGTAALIATGSASTTPLAERIASADLSAQSDLTVDGDVIGEAISADATITITATIEAEASVTRMATVELSATSVLASGSKRIVLAQASITALATLATQASRDLLASVALSGMATLTVNGGVPDFGANNPGLTVTSKTRGVSIRANAAGASVRNPVHAVEVRGRDGSD